MPLQRSSVDVVDDVDVVVVRVVLVVVQRPHSAGHVSLKSVARTPSQRPRLVPQI